jgi:hypothetical protein
MHHEPSAAAVTEPRIIQPLPSILQAYGCRSAIMYACFPVSRFGNSRQTSETGVSCIHWVSGLSRSQICPGKKLVVFHAQEFEY